MQCLYYNNNIMWKLRNRSDRVISIPGNLFNTAGKFGVDVINTVNGVLLKDATSVILNTKHKIADLFSKDLKRYHYLWNAPVAVWVWLAWAVEAVAKTVVNGVANTWKTAGNLISNVRKSTLWSIFSTKPVSDISFNTIKTKKWTINTDTTKDLRNRDSILAENWWFLTKDKKIELYKKKLWELWATT